MKDERESNFQEHLESDSENVTEYWPGLEGHFKRTSDPDIYYDGLAWALSSKQRNFGPEKVAGYYWPSGIPRERTTFAFKKVLESNGFDLIARDSSLEEGWEKVALYVDSNGEARHVARQLANGNWTSKLADLIDIEHDNLQCLEGDHFGSVTFILMRRRRNAAEA